MLPDAEKLTPMMRQYAEQKRKYADCLLFYRLGDFYEMFFDDAVTASKELQLTLTGRDAGLPERAPMCGVPYHSAEGYIAKLIKRGYKVAICEQLTDPTQSKGLVERGVIRVITPGTVIEEKLLDVHSNNFIAVLCPQKNVTGLAYADVSTGEFFLREIPFGAECVYDELARIMPKELLLSEDMLSDKALCDKLAASYYLQKLPESYFERKGARTRLLRHFGVQSLQGYGCEDKPAAVRAAGALLLYLEDTRKNTLEHIVSMRFIPDNSFMQLDENTRRNLELTEPIKNGGSEKNTLLYLLRRTQTAPGARKLRNWVDCPLQDKAQINARLDAVEELVNRPMDRIALRETLSKVYDLERLCGKVAYGTVSGRDCLAIKYSLLAIPRIKAQCAGFSSQKLSDARVRLDEMEDIAALLAAAISEDAPVAIKDGGLIRDGYNPQVDELRAVSRDSGAWLERIAERERRETGIKSLKIAYNHVFGYYIEISKSYAAQAPYHYERKQTLANSERYITAELKELEEKILHAADSLQRLETELFQQIRQILLSCCERMQTNAFLLSEIDALQSLATAAADNKYVRPEMTDDGAISITAGRHPVVEQNVGGFIPNDVRLNNGEDRLLIITGPNMAGKSTYMRQTALIVLMAHIGSFVPAKSAKVCLADRIFTRIGASDDLSSGQSTFMVEMSETANILNNATEKSLLLLDEIGRGTSTTDGLCIARAILEHIAKKLRCKTLFATHYHELSELEGIEDGVKNYRVSVDENGENVVFLHKIVRGSGDKSFGIYVAKLAGIPRAVLLRAKKIRAEIDATEERHERRDREGNMTLFEAATPNPVSPAQQVVLDEIAGANINEMTPLMALQSLQACQELLNGVKRP